MSHQPGKQDEPQNVVESGCEGSESHRNGRYDSGFSPETIQTHHSNLFEPRRAFVSLCFRCRSPSAPSTLALTSSTFGFFLVSLLPPTRHHSSNMASLRQTLPRLLHQIHTPSPTTLLRHTLLNNAPSKASTSASLRRALSTTPSRTSPHLPPSSPFANLAKRFTASANTSRGVSTSPVVRPGQTTGDSVDWTAVATRVGLAAVAAVGLNYALNRETRSPLSAYEAD